MGSFQHQQPGLLDLHAGQGNVCQDRALLNQGLPKGHTGLCLWTQETGWEAWKVPCRGEGGAQEGAAGEARHVVAAQSICTTPLHQPF